MPCRPPAVRSVLAAAGCVLLLGAALALPRAAEAISVLSAPAGVVATPFAGGVSLDPAFADASPLAVGLQVTAEDGDTLALNAVVDNLTGGLWDRFDVTLEGAAFASVGSVGAIFGGVDSVEEEPAAVRILLDPAEPFGLDLGDVTGSGTDWEIDLAGLAVGATFEIAFAPQTVPEPGAALLALAALLGGAMAARRGVASG